MKASVSSALVLCHVAVALAMLDLSAMDLFNMTGKKGAKENLDLLSLASLPGLLEKSPADHSRPTNGTDKKGWKDSLSLFDHSAKNSTKSATWKDSLNLFDHSAKNGTKSTTWKDSLNLFDHSDKNGTKPAKSFLPSFATDLLSHVTGKGKQQSAKVRTRLVYMPKTIYVPVYITENPLEAGSAAAQAPVVAGNYFYPGYPGFPGYGFVQGGEYLQTIAAMGPQYSVAAPPQVPSSNPESWTDAAPVEQTAAPEAVPEAVTESPAEGVAPEAPEPDSSAPEVPEVSPAAEESSASS